jgi:hypothetical protein
VTRFSIRQLAMAVDLVGMSSALLSALRCGRLGTAIFDPYHPELHYMRGPGPKWRGKHAAPYLQDSNGAGNGI